jgi:hypothetical protein
MHGHTNVKKEYNLILGLELFGMFEGHLYLERQGIYYDFAQRSVRLLGGKILFETECCSVGQ